MITANIVPKRVEIAGKRMALLIKLLSTKGNTKIANTKTML